MRSLVLSLILLAACAAPTREEPLVTTFSIAAIDTRTGDLGVAVASRFLAVGAVVPWARARTGAIATQARANTTFGPLGLDLLAQGVPAAEVLARLLEKDPGREKRQVGIVDRKGGVATFTGTECND